VTNLSGGPVIVTNWPLAVNVTIQNVTAQGGSGRFFEAEGFKSVTIRNCTIEKTGGIGLSVPVSGATVVVTRNTIHNVQKDASGSLRQFLQFNQVTTATVDVSWNQIVNVFGESAIEDAISIYRSAHIRAHDNYIQGGYPATLSGSYSGGGITIEEGSYDNDIANNVVVDAVNGGIGIAGGHDNAVHGNRVISDGRLDGGPLFASANVGLVVWNSNSDPAFANNHATGNTVGWVRYDGKRNNMWFPDAPFSDYGLNTEMPDQITDATENAEWPTWLAKLTTNNIQIGA
jgi:hypothetical protein